MAKSKLIKANKKIENGVVGGYKKIEDTVVGSYKQVENKKRREDLEKQKHQH